MGSGGSPHGGGRDGLGPDRREQPACDHRDHPHPARALPNQALEYVDHTSARPIVLGDGDELKAAVWNLIDNAVKYSIGAVKVRVELDEIDNQRLAIRVTDNGLGISPAELKRIFRRFYRIPTGVAVRTKGSGLGLFIVRSVARKHGGRAFAESAGAGHGSTFTLQLPGAPPASA